MKNVIKLLPIRSISLLLALALIPVAAPAQVQPLPGGALAFNSSQQSYVQVASNASLTLGNHATFEAWVKPTTNSALATVISRGDGGVAGLTDYIVQLQSTNGGFKLAFFGVGVWDYSAHTVPTNAWSHVAVTYDGTNKVFYLNGAPDS